MLLREVSSVFVFAFVAGFAVLSRYLLYRLDLKALTVDDEQVTEK